MKTAAYWMNKLALTQHVEGGAFKEVYRSGHLLPQNVLSPEHQGARTASTSIYFLLQRGEFSAFHRIASDEVWHFYEGGTLSIYEIDEEGVLMHHLLGRDPDRGEALQVVIPAGSWFASRVAEGEYVLCGCTVAPGFDFEDFELAERGQLQQQFPAYTPLIEQLTRV